MYVFWFSIVVFRFLLQNYNYFFTWWNHLWDIYQKIIAVKFSKKENFFVGVRKKFSKKFIFNHLCPTKHVVNTAIPRIISESNHAETTCRYLCMVGKDGMQMSLYATNHWLVRYKQMVYSIQSYCLHHLKLSFASSKAMVYAF